MAAEEDIGRLRDEIAYYKRQLDEVAGENLKFDYQISGLKKEVRQGRQAFTLLSELQRTIRSEKEISKIFETAIKACNATLGMDKTVVLTPAGAENLFRATSLAGFEQASPELLLRVANTNIEFPRDF